VHRSIQDNVDFFAAERRANRCLPADHAKGTCFAYLVERFTALRICRIISLVALV
jgi:hypothetical protein